jgi:hypothetical protein
LPDFAGVPTAGDDAGAFDTDVVAAVRLFSQVLDQRLQEGAC